MKYESIGNGIMNTKLPVKDNVVVSLSYSLPTSCFMSIGTKEQPQGVIMLSACGIEDMYSFEYNKNTKNCETQADIDSLVAIAHGITPTHCIYVFDTRGKEACSWLPRFIVQEDTEDMQHKLEYLSGIYSKNDVKIKKL